VRAALRDFFERSSAYVANIEEAPADRKTSAIGPGCPIHQEIARRWDAQREIDGIVAAVRAGEAERAVTLAESPAVRACFDRNRSLVAGVLRVMIRSGNEAMLRYVRDRIAADPALAQEHYAGRTLLHEASAQGNPTLVKLLLDVGADPNDLDGGGHTPLYSVANECSNSGAGTVVRALAARGANVNADDGVKRCTALHMAARRGNVAAAEALLDWGADIEARDSLGETPLRRAVNCGKIEVASLLLNRGADVHSKGSKSLTPLSAARTTAMKQLLQSRIG
jgi:ankyrin repeat protein